MLKCAVTFLLPVLSLQAVAVSVSPSRATTWLFLGVLAASHMAAASPDGKTPEELAAEIENIQDMIEAHRAWRGLNTHQTHGRPLQAAIDLHNSPLGAAAAASQDATAVDGSPADETKAAQAGVQNDETWWSDLTILLNDYA